MGRGMDMDRNRSKDRDRDRDNRDIRMDGGGSMRIGVGPERGSLIMGVSRRGGRHGSRIGLDRHRHPCLQPGLGDGRRDGTPHVDANVAGKV